MSNLVDPFLKLSRAKKHIDALRPLIDTFNATDPFIFTREDDVENQQHILSGKVRDVPDDIPLTVGDAFYNLRSSLDQLVWSLAKGPGKILDPQNTQFPIIGIKNLESEKRFKSQIRGVPFAAVTEIDGLQPYHRGVEYKAPTVATKYDVQFGQTPKDSCQWM